jgi:hypothetical protein
MKNLIIILSLALVLQFSLISAIGTPDITRPNGESGIVVQIQDNTINISGYTITLGTFVNLDYFPISKVSNPLGATVSCNQRNVTDGNTTVISYENCTYNANYIIDIPIPIISQNETNISSLLCLSQEKYDECLTLKAQYGAGLDACTIAKNINDGAVANYSTCALSLNTCQSERSTATSQVATLTTDAANTKNQKWIFGVVGIAAGIFGTLYFKGFLGKPRIRSPDESFNRSGSH